MHGLVVTDRTPPHDTLNTMTFGNYTKATVYSAAMGLVTLLIGLSSLIGTTFGYPTSKWAAITSWAILLPTDLTLAVLVLRTAHKARRQKREKEE